jgi:hypothetical protein
VLFHSDLPPACLGLAPSPLGCEPSVVKSIIKTAPSVNLRGNFSLPNPLKPDTGSCEDWETSPHITEQRGHSAQCAAREGKDEIGWQIVRRPKWWRNHRKLHVKSPPSAPRLQKRKVFLEKLKGRCFNYFARDHLCSHCREPTKCWRCKSVGHISPCCPSARASLVKVPLSKNTSQPPISSTKQHRPTSVGASMERRCSFGSASAGFEHRDARVRGRSREPRGSAVNYPGNPWFHPRVAFKLANTSKEMEQHCVLLTNHVVQSKEEVKNLLKHHFGVRKHELYVYHSHPEPFIMVFSESHAHDLVFASGRLVDGPIELSFHSWDLNRFGSRDCILYHVRLCIEGIPQHAWCREIAEKVLYDQALIHHVEEVTLDRSDQRSFKCWVFTKGPSQIPRTVFLSLLSYEVDLWKHDLVHFSRPRSIKHAHVF